MLNKEHHPAVLVIYQRNTLKQYRYKKICRVCGNKRFTGYDSENRLIVCERCVNTIPARKEWIEYCKNTPGLFQYL